MSAGLVALIVARELIITDRYGLDCEYSRVSESFLYKFSLYATSHSHL